MASYAPQPLGRVPAERGARERERERESERESEEEIHIPYSAEHYSKSTRNLLHKVASLCMPLLYKLRFFFSHEGKGKERERESKEQRKRRIAGWINTRVYKCLFSYLICS